MPRLNPAAVFFTLVELTFEAVGGSAALICDGMSCLIMNMLGPSTRPTSILSVTGIIHMPVKWTAFSL